MIFFKKKLGVWASQPKLLRLGFFFIIIKLDEKRVTHPFFLRKDVDETSSAI
jgi:hypothetical protein